MKWLPEQQTTPTSVCSSECGCFCLCSYAELIRVCMFVCACLVAYVCVLRMYADRKLERVSTGARFSHKIVSINSDGAVD